MRCKADKPLVDRRRHVRVPLLQEVECEWEIGKFRTHMSDISAGGMFLENVISLQPGSIITVRFSLPNFCETIVVTAQVRHVQRDIGSGIKFLDLKPEDEQKIEELAGWIFRAWRIQRRRSDRLPVNIPVLIKGAEKDGMAFEDQATIVTLSKNGACILTDRVLAVDAMLSLYVPAGLTLGSDFTARVVWVGDELSETKGQVGIQCRGLARYLGYKF